MIMALWFDIQNEDDYSRLQVRREAYFAYLNSVASYLPAATRDFALSDWYYSDSDKNPHDSWVERVELIETSSGERKQTRNIHINVELLSASHNARIVFRYENVVNYQLGSFCDYIAKHEDWLADEVTVGSGGTVLHEIAFSSGLKWKIQCKSISYEYVPLDDSS